MLFEVKEFIAIGDTAWVYNIKNGLTYECEVLQYSAKVTDTCDKVQMYIELKFDDYVAIYPSVHINCGVIYNDLVVFSLEHEVDKYKNKIDSMDLISTKRKLLLSLNDFVSQGKLQTLNECLQIIEKNTPKPCIQKHIFISVDGNEPNDYDAICNNEIYLDYIVTGGYINNNREVIICAIPKEDINYGCEE